MDKRLLLVALAAFLGLLFLPVVFRQLNPPQPRRRPPLDLAGMTYHEIRFANAAQGITLAGMLFVPEGDPPFPGVVIIHGSGTSSRANRWYLTYAGYLQRNGIAVLLPDKRGSEASGGDWRASSLEDLATDTQAALSYLRTERARHVEDVGILGVSQGGIIASIVAAGSPELAFAINVVGGAVPMHELLMYEETNNLGQMGFLPRIADVIASLAAFYDRHISQRAFWSAVGNFDPLPYWREANVPVLVLLGDRDTNVPSERSRERLRALNKPNLRVVVFEGSGHGLDAPPGVGGDYIREDALELIREFIFDAAATH